MKFSCLVALTLFIHSWKPEFYYKFLVMISNSFRGEGLNQTNLSNTLLFRWYFTHRDIVVLVSRCMTIVLVVPSCVNAIWMRRLSVIVCRVHRVLRASITTQSTVCRLLYRVVQKVNQQVFVLTSSKSSSSSSLSLSHPAVTVALLHVPLQLQNHRQWIVLFDRVPRLVPFQLA